MLLFCFWFRAYSKQLCEYRDQCGYMLEEVGKALEYLQEMNERHQQVSHKTSALHQACEQLVDEQVKKCSIKLALALHQASSSPGL